MTVLKKVTDKLRGALNVILNRVLREFHTLVCDHSLRMVFQKEMEDWEPDIVHAHDGIALPVAAKVAETCNAKLVFDSHELETHRNPPLPRLRKWQVRRLERTYLPKADAVFTVGDEIAAYLAREYGIAKPVVLYNSPPKHPLPVAERWQTIDRNDLRSELYIPSKSFLVVHTGNVTFHRGIEHAVVGLSKAADVPEFKERYPNGVHLALVGNRVPAVVARVKNLIKKYDNKITIHYVDPVSPDRVVQYIKSANASILPAIPLVLSYEFSMPNKLFESILANLPIIASDVIEVKKIISEHNLGVTYEADNTDRLAEAFLEFSLNIEGFQRTEEKHLSLISSFSWEKQGAKMLDVYAEL